MSNAVANKEYIERLKLAVEHLHKCSARHIRTFPVREEFEGKTIWQGDVELFLIFGNMQAQRCYAWSHRAGADDKDERFVAVLEMPPVTSPETAVKVAIAAEVKKRS